MITALAAVFTVGSLGPFLPLRTFGLDHSMGAGQVFIRSAGLPRALCSAELVPT